MLRSPTADILIRALAPTDLDGALELSSANGWNQRRDDWEMLNALAPHGTFVAVSRERVVGTAIGIDYGGFSWIAMMLVDPEFRGRGLGRRLLQAALEAVPASTPVRLDATPMGRPLYRTFGFEDEATLIRFTRGAAADTPPSDESAGPDGARPMSAADLATVAEADRLVFGGDRLAVLDWAFNGAPEFAFALEAGPPGRAIQYCFGRYGRLFAQVGPVVAASADAAQRLVRAALSVAHGRALTLDVFEQGSLAGWLTTCGFAAQRPLFRMRRPPVRAGRIAAQPTASPFREFAILGPEFG